MINIQLLGLNHKSAPIQIREKFSFSETGLARALAGLKGYKPIEECLILSTCNRTEIYVAASDFPGAQASLWDFISRSMDMPQAGIREYFYLLENKKAVAHLFRVASSLDSMIIGETQIFGQVKDAYFKAREADSLGRFLNDIFEEAIRTGKKVRTLTQIGKGAISTSTAAIELARKIFETLEDKKILIIGAGKIGELTVKNLSSRGVKTVIVANRTMLKARELAERFCGQAINFENILDYMSSSDIIVSSTSAPHFVITSADLLKVMRSRNNAPLFLIDLGLPRNIEPKAGDIGNVYLYNIDDLAQVCDANIDFRRREAGKAEQIVDSCVEAAMKKIEMGMSRRQEGVLR